MFLEKSRDQFLHVYFKTTKNSKANNFVKPIVFNDIYAYVCVVRF